MKKWIWAGVIVILLIIGAGFLIYIKAMEPFSDAEQTAVEIAKKEASLTTVDEFTIYNGSKTYYIVEGKDSKGKQVIVWIPEEEKNRKITIKKANEGISREEAVQIVSRKKAPLEIMSVKLGMENNIPLWEIYYRSRKDSISYYYLDFATGKMLKDIENL